MARELARIGFHSIHPESTGNEDCFWEPTVDMPPPPHIPIKSPRSLDENPKV